MGCVRVNDVHRDCAVPLSSEENKVRPQKFRLPVVFVGVGQRLLAGAAGIPIPAAESFSLCLDRNYLPLPLIELGWKRAALIAQQVIEVRRDWPFTTGLMDCRVLDPGARPHYIR